MIERKISRKGGITIPADVRRALGISGGEKVELTALSGGDLQISRVTGSCLFCGSRDGLIKLDGRYVCGKCVTLLHDAWERGIR